MSLKNIKLVTFDVTNTLLKFKVPVWNYYAKIARDHGFTGTEEDVKTNFKKTFKQMSEEHPNFGKKSIEWEDWWCRVVSLTLKDHMPGNANLNEIAQTLINEFRTDRCWQCAQGGDKLIDNFKKLGITVGVISNFDPRLHDILQNVSLSQHFDFIVTSYEVGYSKPDKQIFSGAINKCIADVAPSEALHIGDDVVKDYEGARAAGWHALLVNPTLGKGSPPSKEHVFKTLEDLSIAVEEMKLKL
uniref:Haloacid dehalogenase-like hydrolase domain-containing protein 3 n=1 Tax=Heliothis virescens TaxID=7102 RepID=A0A2A4JIR9_HELVI